MAANPILPAAGQLQLQLQLNAQDVDAVMGNPTDGQIVREHNRFVQIENAQKKGADLDDNEFSGAIMRYHNVVNIRSGFDLNNNNAAIAIQLAAMQQQIQDGFQGVNARIDAIEARMAVDRARNYNKLHCFNPAQNLRFRPLVKYHAGHPALQPPPGAARLDHPQQLVLFAQPHGGYPVGSNPPAGLMPQNLDEYRRMNGMGHANLRRALRAIHWFYNDPMLELTAHAGLGDTLARLNELGSFIVEQ
ncbi:hypothetical protein OROMI_005309 [Orobanche minor]